MSDEEARRRRLEGEVEPVFERLRDKNDTDSINELVYELGETRIDLADLALAVEKFKPPEPDGEMVDKLMQAFCDPGSVVGREGRGTGEELEELYSWQRRAVKQTIVNIREGE